MRKCQSLSVFAASVVCLLLAACGSSREIAPGITAVSPPSEVGPGQIGFELKNPDPEKWTARVQTGARDGTIRTGYTCKVLVCPEPANVLFSRSLNRGPKLAPAALEKLAKETIPKLTQAKNLELQVSSDNRAKIETLSSTATRFGANDAVLNETRITVEGKNRFRAVAMIMAGRMIVMIDADAGDRATARRAIDEFARSFTITEGPAI